MKITKIDTKEDKNKNPMKVITTEDKTTIFVNSKYNKEVFEVVKEDSEIEIEKEGDFWRIKPESVGVKEAPKSNYPSKAGKVQEEISKNVSKAQDRTAIMWAKNNAAELVANHPAYKDIPAKDMGKTIQTIANGILNMTLDKELADETEPF